MKQDKEYNSGPLFLRDLGIMYTHDFDRMTDKVRLWSRSAPWSSLNRSGIMFKKLVSGFDLPDKGTAERDGADMILNALSHFLESHEK